MRRLVPYLALAATSLLVITVVVTSLWALGSASGERAKFSSLEIAPRDADVFVAINTDPTSPQWLAVVDSLGTINAKDPVRRAIDEALAEVNLDWEEDILPIAGDEGFLSIPDVSEVDEEGGYVAAFRLRDTARAREVFDGLRERAEEDGETFESEEYEGVTIHYVAETDLDGEPSTASDCEVNDEGTILCDDQAPIPQDPFWECAEIGYELSFEGRSTTEGPDECQPFFLCPDYWTSPDDQEDAEDKDGDGLIDSCEEADRIEREWEESIGISQPHEDCADLEDVTDYRCEDLTTFVGTGGAVALFADVLAVGFSPEDVKAVIDVVHGRAPSAEENERLQELREGQKEDFLMWGYADLEPVWDMAEAAIPPDFGAGGDSGGNDSEASPTPPVEASPEPQTGFVIPSFDAEYQIADGALHVTERIAVDFGQTPRQGIDRDISTRITYDFINDVLVTIEPLTVTRDGAPEPFEYSGQIADYGRIRTGDPAVMITGQHTYEIEYVANGALIDVEGEDLPFYDIAWNVTGDNWGVPIERAQAILTIPEGTTFGWTPCAVGVDPLPAFQEGCSNTQEGITRMRFASGATIEPGSSMAFMGNVAGVSGAPDAVLVPNELLPFEYDDSAPEFPFEIDTEELFEEVRGTYDRVGFSLSATGDGFAFDVTVLRAPDFEPKFAAEATKVFDTHFADRVPADTMFFFAGYDVYGQSWVPLRDYLEDVEFTDGKTLEDFLDEFRDETGLDLEADILSLLTGEYAIAGDVSDFGDEEPAFSILAMLDVADAERAQQSLDRLGEYLEGEEAVKIEKEEGLQRWRISGSDGEVAGIAVNGDRLIAGYPDSTVEDAVAGIDESLADTGDWKRTVGLLPDDTTAIGFVSVARILEEARRMEQAERSFEEATDGELSLEDLTPIRSVGYATTTRDNGYSVRFVVLISD